MEKKQKTQRPAQDMKATFQGAPGDEQPEETTTRRAGQQPGRPEERAGKRHDEMDDDAMLDR